MNFISFSLNGANKSRILETQIKDIIYVLKSSKSKGFINPDKKKFIRKQGGIKCGNRGTGFLDSEGSHR